MLRNCLIQGRPTDRSALIQTRDARPYLDPTFVQRAVEILGLAKN